MTYNSTHLRNKLAYYKNMHYKFVYATLNQDVSNISNNVNYELICNVQ